MKPTVLLYDIDGTLITTGGAGRKAIKDAFVTLHGRADACDHFSFSGMTDRAIVRIGLEFIGKTGNEAAIDEVIATYLEYLKRAIWSVDDTQYFVHAGMRQSIEAARSAGCAIGLGTGNVRAGALAKLERVGLHEQFEFGGFGDDHELRPELIRRGAERGAERLGCALSDARVVIIGDTPKDIAAAQAIGAECIAVATGDHDVSELRSAGATFVFEDLNDPNALTALLG